LIIHSARALPDRVFRAMFRFAFRHDIFIPYTRADGTQ